MTDEPKEEVKRGKGEEEKNRNPEPGTRPSAGSGQGTRNMEPASGQATGPESDAGESQDASPHPLEALLDDYPLREPSEDPVWSVRIVKGWIYFIAFNITWIVLFLILGIFFE